MFVGQYPLFFFAASFFFFLSFCLGVASIWLLFCRLHPYLCSTSSSQPFVFTQHCWLRWSCVIFMCCLKKLVVVGFTISVVDLPFCNFIQHSNKQKVMCIHWRMIFWWTPGVFWWTIEARFCMRHAIPRCWSRAPGTSLRHGSFPLTRTPLAGRRSRWDDHCWC